MSAALEEKVDSTNIVKTIRALQVEQAKQALAEAQLIATRRSGARGKEARHVLIAREKAVEEALRR